MLSAEQVVDQYFLDTRCMLIEIAATLDRYDRARQQGGAAAAGEAAPRMERIYRSLSVLSARNTEPNRAERLLRLFSEGTQS